MPEIRLFLLATILVLVTNSYVNCQNYEYTDDDYYDDSFYHETSGQGPYNFGQKTPAATTPIVRLNSNSDSNLNINMNSLLNKPTTPKSNVLKSNAYVKSTQLEEDDDYYDYGDEEYDDENDSFYSEVPPENPNAPGDIILPSEASTVEQITYDSRDKLFNIISKPGILAGIVGGAIIGILTAVLLIMFIVYRMRKKDEGSYALEETKKPLSAYDYRNCPTKEFYA